MLRFKNGKPILPARGPKPRVSGDQAVQWIEAPVVITLTRQDIIDRVLELVEEKCCKYDFSIQSQNHNYHEPPLAKPARRRLTELIPIPKRLRVHFNAFI